MCSRKLEHTSIDPCHVYISIVRFITKNDTGICKRMKPQGANTIVFIYAYIEHHKLANNYSLHHTSEPAYLYNSHLSLIATNAYAYSSDQYSQIYSLCTYTLHLFIMFLYGKLHNDHFGTRNYQQCVCLFNYNHHTNIGLHA